MEKVDLGEGTPRTGARLPLEHRRQGGAMVVARRRRRRRDRAIRARVRRAGPAGLAQSPPAPPYAAPPRRAVVSGLVEFMPAEALTNRRALLLCNLKPAKMRNIESAAMVLAASNEDHTKVELLIPPAGCAVGDRVSFAGFEGEPLQPQSKKDWEAVRKAWEAVQPDLNTSGDRVAQFQSAPFATAHGVCTVETIANGKIK